MTKILLETINLKKTYEHRNGIVDLFDNVNIKIKRGDLIALVGPSGSGKSSFLHLLALLDDPTKGKILLKNKSTKDFSDEDYLLLMGDPSAIGIACAVASSNNRGRFKCLKWDKREYKYYPVEVNLYEKGEIDE